MVAVIVGMITGSLCMIFALFYLMQLSDPPQIWGIVGACVGGGIFLLSAILMAIMTIAQQRRKKSAARLPVSPGPPEEPAPEPAQSPEPEDLSPGAAMPPLEEEDFESAYDLAESEEDEEEDAGTV